MVLGNTPEMDLPSPRCQHHLGFVHRSLEQRRLEAVLKQPLVHGHLFSFKCTFGSRSTLHSAHHARCGARGMAPCVAALGGWSLGPPSGDLGAEVCWVPHAGGKCRQGRRPRSIPVLGECVSSVGRRLPALRRVLWCVAGQLWDELTFFSHV